MSNQNQPPRSGVFGELAKPAKGYYEMVFKNEYGWFVGLGVLVMTVIVGTIIFRTVNRLIDNALKGVGIPLDEPLISYDTYFEATTKYGRIDKVVSKAKNIKSSEGSSEILLQDAGIYLISLTPMNITGSIAISHQRGEELIGGRTILHWVSEKNEVLELLSLERSTIKVFFLGLNKNAEDKDKNLFKAVSEKFANRVVQGHQIRR